MTYVYTNYSVYAWDLASVTSTGGTLFPDADNGKGSPAGSTFTISGSASLTKVTVRDNDSNFNDGDTSQDATAPVSLDGTTISAGDIAPEYSYIVRPAGSSNPADNITVYAINMGNNVIGFVSTAPMQPGQTYSVLSLQSNCPSVPYSSLATTALPPLETLDGIVEGTGGADLIDYNYTGDPDGDEIDHNDAILPGEAPQDDIVEAGAGNDTVYAGEGDDDVRAGAGDDLVHGQAGNDSLVGGEGNDTLDGGAGDDTLLGGSDDDSLIGGDGNDVIWGDNAGAGGATPDNVADPLTLSAANVKAGSQTGADGCANAGDSVIYKNVTVTEDGHVVMAKLILVDRSSGLNVDLTGGAGSEILLNGNNDAGDAGKTASFRLEFYDQLTGLPIDISSIATFGDLDKTQFAEKVGIPADQFTNYGLTADTSLTLNAGSTITATGTEQNDPSDQDAWFSAAFENRGFIEFTLTTREVNSGFTLNGAVIDQPVIVDLNPGNDTLEGGDGDDTLYGEAGNDLLTGGAGDDYLSGGDGDDTFVGGAGNDTFQGNAGLDVLDYSASGAGVTVDLSTSFLTGGDATGDVIEGGIDGVIGSGFADALTGFDHQGTDPADTYTNHFFGMAGDDTLNGKGADDLLDGGAGDDDIVLENGFGIDTIIGGETEELRGDVLDASAVTDDLTLILSAPETGTVSDGTDTANFVEIEEFLLGSGDDTVIGSGGDDVVDGGAGNDLLTGGEGADSMSGGDDRDTFIVGAGAGGAGDFIDGGEGGDDYDVLDLTGAGPLNIIYDALNPENGTVQFLDGDGNVTGTLNFVNIERVITDQGDGIVEGTGGDDLIDLAYTGDPEGDMIDNSDALLPGEAPQDDIVEAGAGDDTVYAGLGDDDVYGEAGDDELHGEAGDDLLVGGSGADTLLGGGDDDTLLGGDGNDSLIGGDGNDHADGGDGDDVIDTSGGGALPLPDLGYPGLFPADANPLNDLDTVYGGAGNDTIRTGDDADWIDGGSGNDVIDAGVDRDTVAGGDGDDFIVGGEGSDVIDGGTGNDTIYGGLDPSFPDNLNIPDATDLVQDNGRDTITGGDGDDVIFGQDDDDLISGDAGNDYIDGGIDEDTITGGTGSDTVIGGEGADSMAGGADRDTFLVGTNSAGHGDFIDGNEEGDDFDTLNLTGAGPLRVIYDPLNPENGTVEFLDGVGGPVAGTLTFKNIENVIPCFTPGTLVATPRGEVAVEDLKAGDRVITRDNGIQQIRWVGKRALNRVELAAAPHLRPVLIRAGSLGQGLPERDMLVSPNHRMLVANDRTALYFEEHEVLVAAKHLVDNKGIKPVEVLGTSYLHFMFDRHEVVLANGAWTESFQPGDQTLGGMGNAQRAEIFELFPDLKTPVGVESYGAARRTLKKHEAALLVN